MYLFVMRISSVVSVRRGGVVLLERLLLFIVSPGRRANIRQQRQAGMRRPYMTRNHNNIATFIQHLNTYITLQNI